MFGAALATSLGYIVGALMILIYLMQPTPGTALVQSEIIIQESASHPPQHGLYVQTGILQFPL